MMLLTILGTIQAFHHQRRMHAVGVCDTEMTSHKGILMTTVIVHIVGTIVARIFVFTILNLRIVELGTIYFFACQTIYYRDIERRIALLLVLIVGDAIAIDIKDATLERIQSEVVCRLIPEASTLTSTEHNLSLTIAVDIVSQHFIILTSANPYVWSHIDSPQICTIGFICLHLIGKFIMIARHLTNDIVVFAIAIKVGRPNILRIEAIRMTNLALKLYLHKGVGVWLIGCSILKLANTACQFLAIDNRNYTKNIVVVKIR